MELNMFQDLFKTPLHALHIEMGGKMIPFANHEMPVQYALGVRKEHIHCRKHAGLFDVSHMGQLRLHGVNAAKSLETLVPVDIIDLPIGKQRYALFTNEQGGVMDDFMVTNLGDHLFLVVNAAFKEQDIAHLRANLLGEVELEVIEDHALLALQGPEAAKVLASMNPAVAGMFFMDAAMLDLIGIECLVSRSGYTGEDGYEISVPADRANELARALLANVAVEWIGLAARNSLRLECGLCRYGHDIDTSTTPVEASLIWALSKVRCADGERSGGFPGAKIILEQVTTKNVSRKRVGLVGFRGTIARDGAILFNADDKEVGVVTSGTFGPTIGYPIAMGYISTPLATMGTIVFAEVRNKKLAMTVEKIPLVSQRYHRG